MKKKRATIILVTLLLALIFACSGSKFPTEKLVTAAGGSIEFTEHFYTVTLSTGEVAHNGAYTVEGNELTLHDDQFHCDKVSPGKATYTWTYEDDTLILQVKDDKCKSRATLLDGLKFHTVPYIP